MSSSLIPLSLNPPLLSFRLHRTTCSPPLLISFSRASKFPIRATSSSSDHEEIRWLREEQRWLREEQRWLREEQRWIRERESLLREISELKLQIKALENRNLSDGASVSVSDTISNIAGLLQMLKEKNMIAERATVAEKEKFEDEEQQKEVVKVLEGEKKKRKALRVGSEGEYVKAMQEELLKLGFFSGEEDMEYSSFSTGTERAVKTWQAAMGVTEDGIMTSELLERLYMEHRVEDTDTNMNADRKGIIQTIPPKEGTNGAPIASITEISEIKKTVVKEGATEVDLSERRVFLLGENRWEEPSRLAGRGNQDAGSKAKKATTQCLTCRGEGRLMCLECDGTGEPNIEPQFIEWVDEGMKCPKLATSRQAGRNGFRSQNGPSLMIVCGVGLNILFVGTEVAPWSKTGGLGDVLGGLPPALAANGHRVMTIAPRYDQYKDAWDTDVVIELKVGDKFEKVRFFHCHKRGVDRVFVDHPWFLAKVWGKTQSKIYGPRTGEDYQDNQLRFSLLCQAALEAPRILNLNSNKYFSGPYGEDVVFVANDWHTSLLPCYLKTMYKPKGMYKSAKVVFCIHNIAYQGRFAFEDFGLLNLPAQFKSSFDFIDGYNKPVRGRKINWMKAGILESDMVLTVSPHYAQELVSGEDKGVELDNIIRKTGIKGIVNGMDVQEWNPLTDKYIGVKYDASTVMDAKPLLKEALQAEVGLPVDRNIPVIGFIGRLEEQKGSDILAAAIPHFIKENVQIIVLGTGKKPMEKQLEQLEILYPEKARGVAKFNIPLAHMIIAGADFILIPSRFEPCGLIQLHAMRYGTVPIVASTGGLVDTVKEGFTGFQMGSFSVDCEAVDPVDVAAVSTTVRRALATYGTQALAEMMKNGMAQDLSWKGPAKKWEETLLNLEVAGSEPGIDGEEIAPLAKENVATP